MTIDIKVRSIIAKRLNLSVDDVQPEAAIVNDLGADSLDLIQLVISMEDEFHLEIPDNTTASLITVKDAIEYLEQQCVPAE